MTDFRLTLTGETVPNRFVVRIDHSPIMLPESRYFGLLVLIKAKRRNPQGRAELRDFSTAGIAFEKDSLHQLIRRIRSDIDSVLGGTNGKSLVVHLGFSRYSLSVDADAIAVDATFNDLRADIPHHLFKDLADLIPLHTLSGADAASDLSAKGPSIAATA